MSAWYQVRLAGFLKDDIESIVGGLARSAADRNLSLNRDTQESWRNTTNRLRESSKTWLAHNPKVSDWTLLFEYEVPRRSRRVDAVLLAHDLVILIEFKDGAIRYDRDARWQAEQYALDIRDFHGVSRGKKIATFLVATGAEQSLDLPNYHSVEQLAPLACVNFSGLTDGVENAFSVLAIPSSQPINAGE